MSPEWKSGKYRRDTRQRYQDALKDRSVFRHKQTRPWYRQRQNFFPLLMLFVFFVLMLAVKGIYNVGSFFDETTTQETTPNTSEPSTVTPTPDDAEMDYEKAKKIFGG